jgi:hypothetical protein
MKMKVSGRGTGKTLKCLIMSDKKQYPIICESKYRCTDLKLIAEELGLEIPEPINFNNYTADIIGRKAEGYIIDDVDYILQSMFDNKVKFITLSTEPKAE